MAGLASLELFVQVAPWRTRYFRCLCHLNCFCWSRHLFCLRRLACLMGLRSWFLVVPWWTPDRCSLRHLHCLGLCHLIRLQIMMRDWCRHSRSAVGVQGVQRQPPLLKPCDRGFQIIRLCWWRLPRSLVYCRGLLPLLAQPPPQSSARGTFEIPSLSDMVSLCLILLSSVLVVRHSNMRSCVLQAGIPWLDITNWGIFWPQHLERLFRMSSWSRDYFRWLINICPSGLVTGTPRHKLTFGLVSSGCGSRRLSLMSG